MTRYPRIAASALCAILVVGCGPRYGNLANIDSTGSTIVCFGDSNTRGYGASPGRDYPAVLAQILGRPVINAGRDGDTTGSGLARLGQEVLAHDPWLVIVSLGGNDFLQGVPRETVIRNLDAITERCLEHGTMVVLVHAKFGIMLSDPYRDGLGDIAKRRNVLAVWNVLRDILGRPNRMYDSIHPNDEGNALIAERVAKVVAPLIDARESRQATRR